MSYDGCGSRTRAHFDAFLFVLGKDGLEHCLRKHALQLLVRKIDAQLADGRKKYRKKIRVRMWMWMCMCKCMCSMCTEPSQQRRA